MSLALATRVSTSPPAPDCAAEGFALVDNPAWAATTPRLSVLTPFFRDDPRPLLATLEREAGKLDGAIELVVLDDCGGLAGRSDEVADALRDLTTAARLIRLDANAGRARGRNHLIRLSRARHVLFLDADMAPDTPDFLAAYLRLISQRDVAVAFGGFSVDQAPHRPEHALHRALARRGECLDAATRALEPSKYVYTSNLLVRRDVLAVERFDEAFTGWGWEDVEWGLRAGARFGVVHIDNPATHLGLDTAEALADKYAQSPPNFARVLAKHPEMLKRFPSYRLAKAMRGLPARAVWRAALRALALAVHAPLKLRVVAMKAYRAALYAEVV